MSKILKVNTLQQYVEDAIKYAIEVNFRRAVPDIRDGLKPVQRRILAAMWYYTKCRYKTIKTATAVGDTMKLHPHGDSSIEGGIKPMTNWFESYMPICEGQGGWGNVYGEQAAASRYTEIKFSDFGVDCVISDLKDGRNVIDWIPNYNNTLEEPEYFPVAVPLLLINGGFGIGYGMKFECPTHNINEVIDATVNLIDNPNADVVLIPDLCQECEIVDTNWKKISHNGYGTFTARGKIDIEPGPKGTTLLVIKSVPNLVYIGNIVRKVEEMVKNKEISDIIDHVDETDGDEPDDVRYVFTIRKGADPNYIRDVIYKKTQMQSSCKINFEPLVHYKPTRISYKEYLKFFIEFRKNTKFRMHCNVLQKVKTAYHEKDAYIKVLQSGEVDNIINLIKKQKSADDDQLIEYLVTKLKVTDMQAKYIINAPLKKLSIGYIDKYIEEAKSAKAKIDEIMNIVMNDRLIDLEIKQELLEYKAKYGCKRRCKIVKGGDDMIPNGEFHIIITENNYIKKVPTSGTIGTFKGDQPKLVMKVENKEAIILFDDRGKCFRLPVHKIPISDRNSNGIDIRTIAKYISSNINTMLYEPVVKDLAGKTSKFFLTVLTQNGLIKKMDLDDFVTIPASGILYSKVDDGDLVKCVVILHEKLEVLVYAKDKALRLSIKDVPHQKRSTKGVRVMNTPNLIDGMDILTKDTTDVVVITDNGKMNRFPIEGLPVSARGKAPSKVIKLTKGDSVIAILTANSHNSIHIKTKNDKYSIPIENIKPGSSIAAGDKVLNLQKSDVILRCQIEQ